MKIKTYEELEIWKLSIEITVEIYKVTNNEKWRRDFSLCDQIRRAVVSISSNIVEGFERNNNIEFIHYLKIAKGSAGEVRNQLYIAEKLTYVTNPEYSEISEKLFFLSNKIGRFIAYLASKKRNSEFITR